MTAQMGLHRKSTCIREKHHNDNPGSLCKASSDPLCLTDLTAQSVDTHCKREKNFRSVLVILARAEVSCSSGSEKASGRIPTTENAVGGYFMKDTKILFCSCVPWD